MYQCRCESYSGSDFLCYPVPGDCLRSDGAVTYYVSIMRISTYPAQCHVFDVVMASQTRTVTATSSFGDRLVQHGDC